MAKKSLVVISVESIPELSLEELSRAANVNVEFIQDLIEYGIIEPKRITQDNQFFAAEMLKRVRIAIRLLQDLELNLAGAAVVLDLMNDMEKMRSEMEFFRKHFRGQV